MIQRQKFRTKQARRRERIRFAVKTSLFLLCCIILFSLITYGSHAQQMRMTGIHVQTDGILPYNELKEVVETELHGLYFGIWPRDSILSVPHAHLTEVLTEKFPRIKKVFVKRTSIYSLSVSIYERAPSALWCGDVVPPTAQEQADNNKEHRSDELWGTCYLLDESGYIYASAPLYSGNIFPRYYGSLQHGEPLAQQYIPEDEFIIWQNFYTSFVCDDGAKPQALLFVDERDIELYLTNSLRVLVPRTENPDIVTRRLQALFESENIKENEKVEYIDLRFGNKAFVKYLPTVEENNES